MVAACIHNIQVFLMSSFKTEMAYFAQHTHRADKIARPELYRLNGISHDEKLENLILLLENEEDADSTSIINLPTNDNILWRKETNNPKFT